MNELNIPQCNPLAGYEAQKSDIDQVVGNVLSSGWYVLGEQVKKFETDFSDFLGFGHCLGVANGTDAISIALRTLGIGEGDYVLTVSHTAVATVSAICQERAQPIVVDVSPNDYNMDLDVLEKWLAQEERPLVKALILVHLYGQPANASRAKALCDQYDIILIEDCAQAHGAAFQTKTVGSFGKAATYSFYPTKNLGAAGDGGAVVFQEPDHFEKAKTLRQYGWKTRYISDLHGFNSRLDDLQAAILTVKLRMLSKNNKRRQEIAGKYLNKIKNTQVELPWIRSIDGHVFHQFVIRSKRRDELQQFLKVNNVATLIHYPVPVHKQKAYESILRAGIMDETEIVANEILSLPMFPEMSDEMVDKVIEKVNYFS